MSYNLTAINGSGVVPLFQTVNETLLGGWLGVMILISITIVILTSYIFKTGDSARSLMATSFVSMLMALLLRALSLISDLTLFICVILCAGTIAVVWRKE